MHSEKQLASKTPVAAMRRKTKKISKELTENESPDSGGSETDRREEKPEWCPGKKTPRTLSIPKF